VGPIASLFLFTVRQTLWQRKVAVVYLLAAVPCGLVAVVRVFHPPADYMPWEPFQIMTQFVLLMVVLPLVCILHGSALITSEAENRTFVYLTTRRLHRATVLLVRWLAVAVVLTIVLGAGAVGIWLASVWGVEPAQLVVPGRWARIEGPWSPGHDLWCYLCAIPVAVAGYLALFTLIGLASSRPLSLSLSYFILLELIVGNLPIAARVYSLSHPVRTLLVRGMPAIQRLYELPPELAKAVYPPDTTALPELLGIVAIALFLSAVLVTVRELLPTRLARE